MTRRSAIHRLALFGAGFNPSAGDWGAEAADDGKDPLADLIQALVAQDQAKVAALLDQLGNVNKPYDDGPLPLIVAAEFGDEACARVMLQRGAEPNLVGYALGRNNQVSSALLRAIASHNPGMVRMLLHYGADANLAPSGFTPLMGACSYQRYSDEIVRLLLRHGAEPNKKDLNDRTPLHHAFGISSSPCERTILALVRRVRFIDEVDRWGRTPLHLAAAIGYADGLSILLEHRASVNVLNSQSRSPLFLAAAKFYLPATEFEGQNFVQCVSRLIKAGADRSLKDSQDKTALDRALRSGDSDIIRLLREPL